LRSKTKRIGVRVEPRTWEALATMAALEGRTPSDLARFWIELELGLADEADPGPGKGKLRAPAATAKSPRSRKPRKTRQARRDV
jgi:hypothetical protein